MKNHISNFLSECSSSINALKQDKINDAIVLLQKVKRDRGRLFILGVGGSAGHASHAVNDFRKLCNIESYSPSDNVSELTARINDNGWENSYVDWLKASNLKKKDCILFFSVGGGDLKRKISINLINSQKYAKKIGCKSISVTGKKGYLYKQANCSILIYTSNKLITPISEALTAVFWHCLVSDKRLQSNQTTW